MSVSAMTFFLSAGLSALGEAAPALSLLLSALSTLQAERKLAAVRRNPAISLRWVRRVTRVLLLVLDSCIAFRRGAPWNLQNQAPQLGQSVLKQSLDGFAQRRAANGR